MGGGLGMTQKSKDLVVLSVDNSWNNSEAMYSTLRMLNPETTQLLYVGHYPDKLGIVKATAAALRLPMYIIRPSKNHGKISTKFANFRAFDWRRPERLLLFSKDLRLSRPLGSLMNMGQCRGVIVQVVTDYGA